jgi:sRNA-binding carbon storage regulator CsrA
MLIISRSPGETLLIGESTLAVRQLAPSIRLVLSEAGQLTEYEFRFRDLATKPSIETKDGRVFLQRLQRGRVVLAIDAQRSVRVLKGELAGDARA